MAAAEMDILRILAIYDKTTSKTTGTPDSTSSAGVLTHYCLLLNNA